MNQVREQSTSKAGPSAAQVSRDFDFPRQRVFDRLTDPKKGAVSWSPEEAVNLVFELDLRPGGAIRVHDRDREGNVAKTTGTVVDVVVPELLVVKTSTTPPTGGAPWEAEQTLRFEELGPRKTRVTVQVRVLATGSFPGGTRSLEQGYHGGWAEVFEKLQKALR